MDDHRTNSSSLESFFYFLLLFHFIGDRDKNVSRELPAEDWVWGREKERESKRERKEEMHFGRTLMGGWVPYICGIQTHYVFRPQQVLMKM